MLEFAGLEVSLQGAKKYLSISLGRRKNILSTDILDFIKIVIIIFSKFL